jgi:hypothetical protein
MRRRVFIVAMMGVRVLLAEDDSSALLDRAREKTVNSTPPPAKVYLPETIDRR